MPSTPSHILSRLIIGFTVLGLGAWSLPALAEKADRNKPMHIEADSMRHDENKQLTQFTGKVTASKGTLVLRAERMEVQQDSQGKQVARLWAAPQERVFFRQKREGLDEYTEGEAEMVTYDNQTDIVTLSQRAELRLLRGTLVADRIQGQTIVFNNTTEVIQVDGQVKGSQDTRDQRVRATLTPRNSPDTPSAGSTPQVMPQPALRSSPGLTAPTRP